MFKKLQERWKVNGWRLLLILLVFSLGGSLCGWAGRKLLLMTGLENGIVWVFSYIILITLLWPVSVLLVSIPFGQFNFFTTYIKKIFRRMGGRKRE